MTNGVAIGMGLAVVGFLLLDHFYLGLDAPLVAGRLLMALIEYLAFWR